MRAFDLRDSIKRLNINSLVVRLHSHLRIWTLRDGAFHVISEQKAEMRGLFVETSNGRTALGSHSHEAL